METIFDHNMTKEERHKLIGTMSEKEFLRGLDKDTSNGFKTGYEENYSGAGKAGKCGYGKYFCAGRASDGGGPHSLFGGSIVLFYGGNEV